MAVTFDPATKSADITLSAGNLTATKSGTANASSSTRATAALPTKFYFEATFGVLATPQNGAIGISNSSNSATGGLGGTANSVSWDGTGAVTWNYNSNFHLDFVSAFAAGDVLCVCGDTATGKIYFRNGAAGTWNDAGADPVAGTGALTFITGTLYAAVGLSTQNDALTIKLAAPFTGAVPTGFSAADPGSAATYTLAGATGAFILTGKAAAFKRTYRLGGVTGAFALTGIAATLAKGGRLLAGVTGIFILSGNNATLTYSGAPAATATETPFWRRRRRS